MQEVNQSNFNSKKYLFLSAAVGLIYYGVATKYQLLSGTTLNVQMGAYVLAIGVSYQAFGYQSIKKRYFCVATSIFVIGVATFFTKATWKAKVIGSAILSTSLLIIRRMCTEVKIVSIFRERYVNFSLGDVSSLSLGDTPSLSLGGTSAEEGFDRMVKQPWLEGQLKILCEKKAHFVPGVADDVLKLLNLDELLTENQKPIPTVVLINNKMHYSIVIYNPKEQIVYCFNSLSITGNDLERVVIERVQALFEVKQVVRNKEVHQLKAKEDTWSCGFRVMCFVEHFLDGASMEHFDATPISEQDLARRYAIYNDFLLQELVSRL